MISNLTSTSLSGSKEMLISCLAIVQPPIILGNTQQIRIQTQFRLIGIQVSTTGLLSFQSRAQSETSSIGLKFQET